jgi:hypothetical protein
MAPSVAAIEMVDMAATNGEVEVSPAQEQEEMPLPSDPKVIFLGGLFALAMLTIAYAAAEIVLPFVFAITLKLLLQPILRISERLHCRGCSRRCCSSLHCSGPSSAWLRPFRARQALGQPSFQKAFLGLRSD